MYEVKCMKFTNIKNVVTGENKNSSITAALSLISNKKFLLSKIKFYPTLHFFWGVLGTAIWNQSRPRRVSALPREPYFRGKLHQLSTYPNFIFSFIDEPIFPPLFAQTLNLQISYRVIQASDPEFLLTWRNFLESNAAFFVQGGTLYANKRRHAKWPSKAFKAVELALISLE
jgi:hypothetical protein